MSWWSRQTAAPPGSPVRQTTDPGPRTLTAEEVTVFLMRTVLRLTRAVIVAMTCWHCDGAGCDECENRGWINI
jgi:hypothetical protein